MSDCETLMSPEQLYEELNLDEFINQMRDSGTREICFQGCSAKTGDGIWEGIAKLQEIMDNYENNTQHMDK